MNKIIMTKEFKKVSHLFSTLAFCTTLSVVTAGVWSNLHHSQSSNSSSKAQLKLQDELVLHLLEEELHHKVRQSLPSVQTMLGQLSTVSTAPVSTPSKVSTAMKVTDVADEKNFFIYHTHNRENWSTVPKATITLLGKTLAMQLEQNGIGTVTSNVDYASTVASYKWASSYRYSRVTVKEAMNKYPKLNYFIDIHRDSQTHGYTTAQLKGENYAQVFFIIGRENPHWQANEYFAKRIHNFLQKKYPGISRGIWGKTAQNGNGEYNQSLSPNSILIEVGGIDNTMEESNRTIAALAEAFTQIYTEDQGVK